MSDDENNNGAEAPVETTPVAEGDQASFVAMPIGLLNAITLLIGSEIPWAKADPVMSKLKIGVVAVNLKPAEAPKE